MAEVLTTTVVTTETKNTKKGEAYKILKTASGKSFNLFKKQDPGNVVPGSMVELTLEKKGEFTNITECKVTGSAPAATTPAQTTTPTQAPEACKCASPAGPSEKDLTISRLSCLSSASNVLAPQQYTLPNVKAADALRIADVYFRFATGKITQADANKELMEVK